MPSCAEGSSADSVTSGAASTTATPDSTGNDSTICTPNTTQQPPPNSENPNPTTLATPSESTTESGQVKAEQNSTSQQSRNASDILFRFVETISGKPVNTEFRALLANVVSIRRDGDFIELKRADNSVERLGPDTDFGAFSKREVADVREKLEAKFGAQVGALVDKFVGMTSDGTHIDVQRIGPEVEIVELNDPAIKKKLPLKRIKFAQVSFDLVDNDGQMGLRNIKGIEVTPMMLEVVVELKEFIRTINKNGDEVLSFGVRNPVPKPFRKLIHLKEVMTFNFVNKRSTDSGSNGAPSDTSGTTAPANPATASSLPKTQVESDPPSAATSPSTIPTPTDSSPAQDETLAPIK